MIVKLAPRRGRRGFVEKDLSPVAIVCLNELSVALNPQETSGQAGGVATRHGRRTAVEESRFLAVASRRTIVMCRTRLCCHVFIWFFLGLESPLCMRGKSFTVWKRVHRFVREWQSFTSLSGQVVRLASGPAHSRGAVHMLKAYGRALGTVFGNRHKSEHFCISIILICILQTFARFTFNIHMRGLSR